MKVLFKKIMSLEEDCAVCCLLIFDQKYTIMLDCGISPNFDLTKYKLIHDELKQVQIVLISHSSL